MPIIFFHQFLSKYSKKTTFSLLHFLSFLASRLASYAAWRENKTVLKYQPGNQFGKWHRGKYKERRVEAQKGHKIAWEKRRVVDLFSSSFFLFLLSLSFSLSLYISPAWNNEVEKRESRYPALSLSLFSLLSLSSLSLRSNLANDFPQSNKSFQPPLFSAGGKKGSTTFYCYWQGVGGLPSLIWRYISNAKQTSAMTLNSSVTASRSGKYAMNHQWISICRGRLLDTFID